MYEFTHGGMWFKWSALERTDKALAAGSLLLSIPTAIPLSIHLGEYGYRLIYRLGSGGGEAGPSVTMELFGPWMPTLYLIATACLIGSMVLWWLFSRRQDELFNRIQNRAIGLGSAWAMGLAFPWYLLSLGGFTPPVEPLVLILVAIGVLTIVWIRLVRAWV